MEPTVVPQQAVASLCCQTFKEKPLLKRLWIASSTCLKTVGSHVANVTKTRVTAIGLPLNVPAVNRTNWCDLIHNLTGATELRQVAYHRQQYKACWVRFNIVTFCPPPLPSAEATHNRQKINTIPYEYNASLTKVSGSLVLEHTAHVTCYRFYDIAAIIIADLVE